jgi:hypothetical protein
MRKKILVISILAAALMILLPISAVVGSNIAKSGSEIRSINSPLFSRRVNNILNKDTKMIYTHYIGKGKIFNLFLAKKTSLDGLIDQAIKIINIQPEMFNVLVERIDTIPTIVNVFKENNLNIDEFKNYINKIKNDPNLFKNEINKAVEMFDDQQLRVPINEPPKPLGFSGQLGCGLVFILVILPLMLVIGTMIATFTIITCLNIGGCFEKILESVFSGLQGLTPPDY